MVALHDRVAVHDLLEPVYAVAACDRAGALPTERAQREQRCALAPGDVVEVREVAERDVRLIVLVECRDRPTVVLDLSRPRRVTIGHVLVVYTCARIGEGDRAIGERSDRDEHVSDVVFRPDVLHPDVAPRRIVRDVDESTATTGFPRTRLAVVDEEVATRDL